MLLENSVVLGWKSITQDFDSGLRGVRIAPEQICFRWAKRTLARPMSALAPKADMCSATRDVRFVPIADIDSARSPGDNPGFEER